MIADNRPSRDEILNELIVDYIRMTLFLTSFSVLSYESIQQITLLNSLNEIVRSISYHRANIFNYVDIDDNHENAVWYELERSIATCVSLASNDSNNLAASRQLLSTYKTSIPHQLDPQFDHAFTCALYDSKLNYLWISADWVSSIPIWYAFQDGQYIISTDLLATHYMGFSEPTSLGGGQVMLLDLSSQEIVNIEQDWYTNQQDHVFETDILEVYTRRVALAAISAIETTIITQHSSNSARVTIEIDRMDTSSLFLDCALDALEVERAVRYTRPRIVDSTPVEDAWFQEILSKVSVEFMRTPSASAREESFQSIAIAQWQVCQAAAAAAVEGKSSILLSFDSGLNSRPVELYLQNLFCKRVHVSVVYPFKDLHFQAAAYAARHSTSYFHEALEILRSPSDTSSLHTESQNASVYSSSFCSNTYAHGSRNWNQKDLQGCIKSNCVDKVVKYEKSRQYIRSNPSQMKDKTVFMKSNTSTLVNIWRSVAKHSSEDGIIVLLLVTTGYIDMLINFLCAAQRIDVYNILVLTQDKEVARIAHLFQVGVYIPHSSSTAETVSDADFGTVQYQQLVFSRTELAMELLFAGYQPVIADVDAVWLANPLSHLPWSALSSDSHSSSNGASSSSSSSSSSSGSSATSTEGKQKQEEFDIAITDDNGEVCGCFVALRHTDSAVRFWNKVYIAHHQLLQAAIQSGNFQAVDESEQKILTKLLYKREYTAQLSVLKLSEEAFPSGYAYFTLQSHRLQHKAAPVVVHNNFIVGKALKRARFQRYGMWSTLRINSTTGSSSSSSKATCITDSTLSEWAKLFPKVSRNTSIPSLNMYLPVHSSVLTADSDEVMVHVVAEGPVSIRLRAQIPDQSSSSADFRFPVTHIYVGRSPPAHIEASPTALAVLRMLPALRNSILAFTVTTARPDIAITADVGYLRREFSIDRQNKYAERANEVLLYNIRMGRNTSTMKNKHHQVPDLEPTMIRNDDEGETSIHTGSAGQQGASSRPVPQEMRYSIRVLGYNRPVSLLRLLTSLAAAQYSVNNCSSMPNIPLLISVDGPRNAIDEDLVQQSLEVAEAFVWQLGSKSVHMQSSNVGLAQQWLRAWNATDDQEAAFVFEDDIEVSPYYFLWASRAVEKYYTLDLEQQRLQIDMLQAVRTHIATNGEEVKEVHVYNINHLNTTTTATSMQRLSALEEFVWRSAGKPVLYGVCLQKQHLDPNHYPRQMHVRNGNRPFLYSLIGSWGPLLLPNAWRAFLEWQQWRSAQYTAAGLSAPMETEDLVTNHFLRQNPKIWTPWHVRFAYETGSKCLYSNLPGELGLVVNHREKGENYNTTAGPDAQLLRTEDLLAATELNKIGNRRALTSALWYLPDTMTLSSFQYDFNLRRTGAFGADAAYTPAHLSHAPYEYARVVQQVENAMRWTAVFHSLRLGGQQQETGDLPVGQGIGQSQLSVAQWFHVASILEASVPPGAHFLHLSPSPLLPLLSIPASAYHQSFLSSAVGETSQLWEEAWQWLIRSGETFFESDSIKVLDSFEHSQLRAVDVLVIDTKEFALLQQVQTGSANASSRTLLQDIICGLQFQQPVEYVLTLGACSSAPTDLSLAGPLYTADVVMNMEGSEEITGEWQLVDYMMVEDMCAIDDVDVGAVLYRLASSSSIPTDRRFATTRRLEGGLQSRRIHDATGLVS